MPIKVDIYCAYLILFSTNGTKRKYDHRRMMMMLLLLLRKLRNISLSGDEPFFVLYNSTTLFVNFSLSVKSV